jgi:hypothetical protein
MERKMETLADYEPRQLATILFTASPSRAHSAALAIHEQIAISGDFEHADLWDSVLDELNRLGSIVKVPQRGPTTDEERENYDQLDLAAAAA